MKRNKFRSLVALMAATNLTPPIVALLGLNLKLKLKKSFIIGLILLFLSQMLALHFSDAGEISSLLKFLQLIICLTVFYLFPIYFTERILRSMQNTILVIAFMYLLLLFIGLIEPEDADYFRNSSFFVLRFPFQEGALLAIALAAIEISRVVHGYKKRWIIIIVLCLTFSVTSIISILLIFIVEYKNYGFKNFIRKTPVNILFGILALAFLSPFIEHRLNSVRQGDDVSFLRRSAYSIMAVTSLQGGQIIYGKGHGVGIEIRTPLYVNLNYIPNNFIAALYVQYGFSGLISILFLFSSFIFTKKAPLLILFLPNAYLFSNVAVLLHILLNSEMKR